MATKPQAEGDGALRSRKVVLRARVPENAMTYLAVVRAIKHTSASLIFVLPILLLSAVSTAAAAEEDQPNRIRIEYGPPKTPENRVIYDLMMDHRPLEKFQEIFSPFRLPIEVTLRTKDCDGISNAWYDRPVVTICYEYIADIRKSVKTEKTTDDAIFSEITSTDAIFGQVFYAVAHEMGHAMFDLLDVPIFGKAEDAADGFATYMMLELGKRDAQRFILGAAYSYKNYVKNPRVCVPLVAFADAHGAPMQRYYNLLCIGYGADPQLFAGLVEKGYLPRNRADSCRTEYFEVNFAFHTAIAPHLDQNLAKQVLDKTWLPPTLPAPPPPVSLRPAEPSIDFCSR
jgi:Putative metallopeptidase